MHDDSPLRLEADDAELLLAPAWGGSVLAWRWRGTDLLRPADADARRRRDPLGFAAFPLLPFAGRIDRARFVFRGEEVRLAPNFPPEPHAIHGQGWQSAWSVEDQSRSSAGLVFEHPADAWPWRYRGRQHFELERGALRAELLLENLDDRPMPAGLGWHPYFPRRDAALRLEACSDEALRRGTRVDELTLDGCFENSSGRATIHWPASGLTLRLAAGAPLGHTVVYAPPGRDFFCVEPWTQVPDAVNLDLPAEATGLRVLAPGETLRARWRLEVEPSL